MEAKNPAGCHQSRKQSCCWWLTFHDTQAGVSLQREQHAPLSRPGKRCTTVPRGRHVALCQLFLELHVVAGSAGTVLASNAHHNQDIVCVLPALLPEPRSAAASSSSRSSSAGLHRIRPAAPSGRPPAAGHIRLSHLAIYKKCLSQAVSGSKIEKRSLSFLLGRFSPIMKWKAFRANCWALPMGESRTPP